MNATSLARLDSYLTESLAELFAAHGMTGVSHRDEISARDGDFAAAIGFVGERIKGALILSLGRASLVASFPENLRRKGASDEMLADWGGELANQLLGRLKNGLWSSGVEIALGTPVAFVGEELEHFSPDPMIIRRKAFVMETGKAVAELEIDCAADLELGEPKESFEGLAGGEFSLF
ncbi:MAG TPA: chemotaxis protein CheX [Rectinemataceae bacterium]|nr:chemotaxis protein CheX [Rectinemataceae bacterium]